MNSIRHNFPKNAFKTTLILVLMLLIFQVNAQTTPSISFSTTATGTFNFELRASKANTPIQVDWGNGKQVAYTVGTDSTAISSPAGLAGTTNVSIYGSGINYLNAESKKLTSINITNCSGLVKLFCGDNQLAAIDISKNTELTDLKCNANSLTTLDISKNLLLKNLNCFSNELNTLDISKNINIVSLNCSSNELSAINVSRNTSLTYLNCGSNQLTGLDASKNISIKYLSCRSNKLTTLDVTKNTAIEELYCQYNQISIFDISKNVALKYLDCSSNFLDFQSLPKPDIRFKSYIYSPQGMWHNDSPSISNTIDLSKHLSTLDKDGKIQTTTFLWKCGDMIMKEGTDYRTQAPGIFVFINVPTLLFFCEMTNPAFPDLKGKNAEKFAFLMNPIITLNSNSLNEFSFALDSIVKNNLIIVNYGEGRFYSNDIWNTIPQRRITNPVKIYGAAITELIVQNAGLNSLDVKNCSSLKELDCANNSITTLDVSRNLKLTTLSCGTNKLNALDVTKNIALDFLYCYDNKLTTLDVSKNTALTSLSVRTNQIANLNISNNLELSFLSCRDNRLNELDVTKNSKLTELYCYGNSITFGKLPKTNAQYAKYQYAPQKDIAITKSADKAKAIDLSSQLTARDISGKLQTTVYTWKTKTGNTLTDGKDYNVNESGKFVFLNIPKDSIYCEMSNAAFPDFKDKNIYKTTNVNFELLHPDITVENVTTVLSSISPLGKLEVSWKIKNVGGTITGDGWRERVSLVTDNGESVDLGTVYYDQLLEKGGLAARQAEFVLPQHPGIDGNAKVQVKVIPNANLGEISVAELNNSAESNTYLLVNKKLELKTEKSIVFENDQNAIRYQLFRSGSRATEQIFTISNSNPDRLKISASVTIPAGSSGAIFYAHSIDNQVLNSDYTVTISASGNQYETAIDILTIKDNEIPSLKVTTSKIQLNEGETITLTATRDLVTNKPVTVSLSTNKPSQWTFPASFVIPANTASVDIPILGTNDNIPELKSDAIIYVSASGFTTGQATASLVDDDIPQVSLELLVDTVSESAGVYATWGVIKRVKGDDNITVNLSSNPSNALFFPASITLPKGASEQKFNIGVVDNNEVDGYRKVAISGSVYISSCSCGTSSENGGVVTANLVIADNDGPSLSVSVNPLSLPEGKLNAGTLTISRNTSTNQALTVIISHNDPSEVNIQTSATILAGQKMVQIPINTLNDNIEDGNQMITIQASAATFSSGFGYVFVTDLNKPDLVITDITLNNTAFATNELIEITGSAFNSGFASAPSGVKINFYCSKDKTIDANDILLGEFVFPSPIAQDAPANFLKTLDIPDQTGNYYILAKINPAETITELEYFNNVSDAVDLIITPEYVATAITDNNLYFPNTTIPIHGSAFNNKNIKMPNVDVDVYILNNGTRRELKARTNNLGEYSVEYTPIANESGHYTIGGCYPKQNLSIAQDAFDIPGIRFESASNIIWEMKQGQTIVGKIAVTNTSEATLNHVVIKSDKLPSGCQIKFDTIAVLSGKQTKEFNFTLKATELTSGMNYEKIKFQITSNEKIATDFPAYYYCQALQGQLKADPVSINTSITKGKSRLYELQVYNNGAGETGTVTISLPNVSWMKLVSPATLTNLAPQDTATVILDFSPTADIPLNTPISGNIALNCANGNGLKVPYLLEVVSAETGELKVDVVDEYTYYTAEKPHVKNAHVVIRHPFSGAIVADGYTNSDGTFSVSNLPEGNYKMKVDADKHESFQTTITIDPGRENEQNVFLSFQAITYTWEVVPTEIQDKYEVKLVMKYETNVPVPVVITEMPESMPQLFNDETYPFMVTLTNKGLITALDVQIKFPQNDTEYEFVTNFTKTDLLAQQSIQVPVVMKRRATLKSANIDQSTSSTGSCKAEEITMFGWKCGDDRKWHAVSKSFIYTPRKCENNGITIFDLPFTIEPIRGPYTPIPYNPYSDIITVSSDDSCDPCLIAIGLATIGCFGGPAMNTIQCGLSNLDLEYTTLDAFTCAAGYYPIVGCGVGLLGAAYECNKDWIKSHYPIIPKVLEYPILKSANSETISSLSPILMQSLANLAYVLYAIEGYDEWMTEYMRPMDWYSKVNKIDFFTLIDPFTKNKTPIQTADLIFIQQKMVGTDITANEIAAFASRWNNSLAAWSKNTNSPNADFPDIIDKNQLNQYVQKVDSANSYAISQGYSSVGEMYNKAMADIKEQLETSRNSVCASVSINITQKVVMTREAFEGTLTIFNGHTSEAMKDIKLNLEIKDENGILSNDLFQIDTKSLSVLTGIDGTGELDAQKKGSATVLFIPEKGAAPQVPISYSFGGSFSYLDPFTGTRVTKPLYPVTLQVNPSPDLYLHYFMQRDILGDNALTADIEPIVPAEFAVMIQNNGFGTAKNVRIESAQPKIVENEKGLAINFALTGSNLNGQPKQLGLTNIDFGNIPAQKTAIGQWWFTSDLLGHFVSYDAKVTHLDSRGNPDLSLISGTTLHELIKSIRVYSKVEDGINDFLVNELQDALEFPDVIYLSNGGTLDVYPVISSSISGSIATGNHEIELTVTPKQQGWNYLKFNDPGNGNYKIINVTRNDGQIIPLDNVWQTYVTLPDGKEPVYENKIHLTDEFATNGPQKYTIRFEAKDQNPVTIVRFDNVPSSVVTSPLTSVNVVFNKPVDPATFNYNDMTLRIQGGADVMDNTVIATQLDPVTYKIDFTSKSTQNGYYVLTVQTSQISDLLGTCGLVGKQAIWTQFINVPAVSEFIGLPDTHIGSTFDFLKLRFNLPIDKTTLLPARFTWTKDGTPASGTITITSVDTEGKLFQLSGLKSFISHDGKYSLTVDLPNIKSIDGNKGILTQSVEWEIDQKPPTISKITPSTNGGYDSLHIVAFDILFSEPVNGFGNNSLELWKDGQKQPITQLSILKISDSEYRITGFGLLTYSGGNYELRVKMKNITDIAGNFSSEEVNQEWIVKRTPPMAVTNLHITPDLGFSDSDNITSTRNLTASMTVNEADSQIKLYLSNQGNPILLADVPNAKTGTLSIPVNFDYSGNLTLQAVCIDKYGNKANTEISISIDETAFVGTWKDAPQSALKTQPASLPIEFTEKLLDDTKLKNFLKFECNGQSLETKNMTVSKTTEKCYVVTGMNLAGNSFGAYRLVLDVSKLNKYTSGKEGSSLSQIQWSIENSAPIAYAGENQTVAKKTLVSLDGTGSSDPNNDALTYLWTAPTGIILSSTSVAKPTFIAPEVTVEKTYTFSLVVNDGLLNSISDDVVIKVNIPTGIDPLTDDPSVLIYPNPTKGEVRLKFPSTLSNGTWIVVYDNSGKIIYRKLVESKVETLNLNGKPAGLYFIQIGKDILKTYKIVLE